MTGFWPGFFPIKINEPHWTAQKTLRLHLHWYFVRIFVWRSLCVLTSDFDLELNVRTRQYLFDLEKSFFITAVLALLVRICKILAKLFHKSVLFFKLSTWVLFSLVFSSKTILHVHQNQLQFKDLRPARWKVEIVLYLVTWNYLFFDYF